MNQTDGTTPRPKRLPRYVNIDGAPHDTLIQGHRGLRTVDETVRALNALSYRLEDSRDYRRELLALLTPEQMAKYDREHEGPTRNHDV